MSKNWPLLIFCFFIFAPLFVNAQNFNEFFKIPIPGRVEGKGTHFEIKDSDYLNIILDSEKEIEVVLESIPKMISLNIVSSTEATATLTLKGLEPNKKYFKYEDTHKNETEFFTDQSGSYSWQQDLTKPHHIWIQEIKGTIYLSKPEDCTSTIGIWDENTRTCTLTQDVTTSLEIATSNIVLDCNENNRYSITGNGTDYGVLIIGKESVTIKNCKISNFSVGIYLNNSNNIHLIENDVSYNINGISLSFSTHNELESNRVTHNNYSGVFLYFSSQNKLKDNFVANNNSGIYLQYSGENLLRRNGMENNNYNFGIYVWLGIYSSQILGEINDVDDSNTVDGKSIYYWVDRHGLTIPSNGGCVILVNSSNITVKGLEIKNNSHGILLINTSSSTITENNLENNLNGLVLSFNSNNNQIIANKINKNSFGLEIHKSSGNLVRKNKITNNGSFTTGGYGIFLYVSSGNALIENEILNNNISTSTIGLLLLYSDSNRIYHNNFINNSRQISSDGWPNSFDNGYPSGGNYWSDYSGRDEKWGPDQNQPGPDGIGDTPYCVVNVCDRYPFIKESRWILPKVLISEVYYDVVEGKGKDPYNEWIIIYNSEEREIDISEWKICDNHSCEPLPSIVLLPKSFAIVTASSTTFDFWRIPKGMTKIVLSTKTIGNGLANDGDRVILKDKEGRIVDAMSYGDDKSIFDPPCQDVAEGKSLLRDPPYKDTDTCEDFKESEPTIGKNWPPLPIINFFPQNPIKGIKVKFDASLSDDPDGEITNFEWQIGTSTFTGTTTEFTFNENGEYQVTLTVTDNDGAPSSTSTIIKVEPFSFAIITDLHIGRHYQEEYEGQDYYLTQRLRNVINWINQNKDKIQCGENATCSLKFLVILGDITENTSLAGFCKVKEILDQLQIPYVPVFGNHDVGTDEEYKQCSKWKGQDYFDQVFWSTSSIPCERASSTKNFELLLNELNFQRDEINKDYKNFSISFGGINFIGLDFVSRKHFSLGFPFGYGVGSDAVLTEITKKWLEKKLEEFKREPVILLAHHPIFQRILDAFSPIEYFQLKKILENQLTLFDFGGHVHSFEEHIGKLGLFAPENANKIYDPIASTNVLTTEALMVGSNGRGVATSTPENGVVGDKKGIVRIIKVFDKDNVNPHNWETTEKDIATEFLALNPSIKEIEYDRTCSPGKVCMEFKSNFFTQKPFIGCWKVGDSNIACGSDIFLTSQDQTIECSGSQEELKCSFSQVPLTTQVTLFAFSITTSFFEAIFKKV